MPYAKAKDVLSVPLLDRITDKGPQTYILSLWQQHRTQLEKRARIVQRWPDPW